MKNDVFLLLGVLVRDASGNVMGVYKRTFNDNGSDYNDKLELLEHHVYGSDRCGLSTYDDRSVTGVFTATYTATDAYGATIFTGESYTTVPNDAVDHSVSTDRYVYDRTIGNKRYELKNHLGNVLTVITDQRLGVDVGSTGTINYFTPDVVAFSDYYPYGMLLPGRHQSSASYRYGLNGMEKDDEVSGEGNSYTTEYRAYDSRLGRWKSLDPLQGKYANQSAYCAFNNNPIYFSDPTGLEGEEPIAGQKDVEIVDVVNNSVTGKQDIFSEHISSTVEKRTVEGGYYYVRNRTRMVAKSEVSLSQNQGEENGQKVIKVEGVSKVVSVEVEVVSEIIYLDKGTWKTKELGREKETYYNVKDFEEKYCPGQKVMNNLNKASDQVIATSEKAGQKYVDQVNSATAKAQIIGTTAGLAVIPAGAVMNSGFKAVQGAIQLWSVGIGASGISYSSNISVRIHYDSRTQTNGKIWDYEIYSPLNKQYNSSEPGFQLKQQFYKVTRTK